MNLEVFGLCCLIVFMKVQRSAGNGVFGGSYHLNNGNNGGYRYSGGDVANNPNHLANGNYPNSNSGSANNYGNYAVPNYVNNGAVNPSGNYQNGGYYGNGGFAGNGNFPMSSDNSGGNLYTGGERNNLNNMPVANYPSNGIAGSNYGNYNPNNGANLYGSANYGNYPQNGNYPAAQIPINERDSEISRRNALIGWVVGSIVAFLFVCVIVGFCVYYCYYKNTKTHMSNFRSILNCRKNGDAVGDGESYYTNQPIPDTKPAYRLYSPDYVATVNEEQRRLTSGNF